MSAKFPRIPHLPFSPGATPDDERVGDMREFLGYPVVLTEKMDGANVCLTSETVYARSHSGPATGRMFDELKAYHARVRHLILPEISVFAEWCKAVHTIEYAAENFPRLFVIAVRNDHVASWLGWEYTSYWAGRLGAAPVPTIEVAQFENASQFERTVRAAAERRSCWQAPRREGVVVRPVSGVADSLFGSHFAKFVNEEFKAGEQLSAGDPIWQPGGIPG